MSSQSKTYLALDIGGTKIYGVLYDQDLKLLKDLKLPTKGHGSSAETYHNIKEVVAGLKDDSTLSIGISFAGLVDANEGTILRAPNIPSLNGFPLTENLSKDFDLSAYLENDAKLFALAEATHLKPSPKVSIGIILGTGVGSGIIVNGEIFSGAHGSAGEVGHQIISGKEIENILAGEGTQLFFQEQGWGDDVHAIQAKMRKSKEDYLEAMTPLLGYCSDFLRNLILTYDPDDIVLGGSVGIHFWSIWKEEIIDLTNQKLQPYPLTCPLRISNLENAGALGAGVLAIGKSQQ